jgi:hypothetical protein
MRIEFRQHFLSFKRGWSANNYNIFQKKHSKFLIYNKKHIFAARFLIFKSLIINIL